MMATEHTSATVMGRNICRRERLVRLMMVCDATPAMIITHKILSHHRLSSNMYLR